MIITSSAARADLTSPNLGEGFLTTQREEKGLRLLFDTLWTVNKFPANDFDYLKTIRDGLDLFD